MLDFLGYYRDARFKNPLQDAFHAYYGAHCDFFVTDDDNTYHKAKVIYEHFNIQTVVCKSHEFNASYYGKVVLNSPVEKPLFEIILEVLNSSFVLTNQHDDKFNPVEMYKVDHYIFNYFNRIQVTHEVDHNSIYLYKNSKNYSSFYFWEEIETLTNIIVKEFGVDMNSRSEFNVAVEKKEFLEGNWRGRVWHLPRGTVKFNMVETPFNLTLSVDLWKQNPQLTGCLQ